MATVNNTADGSIHVVDAPLTNRLVDEVAPGLLVNDIDSRILKLRPMASPVDQISRQAHIRPCSSMKVDYYTTGTPPGFSLTSTPLSIQGRFPDSLEIEVQEPDIFAPTDTVLFPEFDGASGPLVAYVIGVGKTGLELKIVNPPSLSDAVIPVGSKVVRMGRAAAELDVQTRLSMAVPSKRSNFCQIFKAQVEQGALYGSEHKEAPVSFSDQEEIALMDMRLSMEKSFLFGTALRFTADPRNGDTYLTQGIWSQAGKTYRFHLENGLFRSGEITSMFEKAFTGVCGSSRKILICGSEFMTLLSDSVENIKYMLSTQTVMRWGLQFREMVTNFGTLYVILSEVFDQCGYGCAGMIIDPEFIVKYVRQPMTLEPLDLRSAGTRNCEAAVITETSCLVLRHPAAHMRLTVDSDDYKAARRFDS